MNVEKIKVEAFCSHFNPGLLMSVKRFSSVVFFCWQTELMSMYDIGSMKMNAWMDYNGDTSMQESLLVIHFFLHIYIFFFLPFSKSDWSCHSRACASHVLGQLCCFTKTIHSLLRHLEIIKEPMPVFASLTYLSASPHFQFFSQTFHSGLWKFVCSFCPSVIIMQKPTKRPPSNKKGV